MEVENNIVLRPRFHKDIALTTETILENAKKLKEEVKEDYEAGFLKAMELLKKED